MLNGFNKLQRAEAQGTDTTPGEGNAEIFEAEQFLEGKFHKSKFLPGELQLTGQAWIDSYQEQVQYWQIQLEYAVEELEFLREANADHVRISMQEGIITRLIELSQLPETIHKLEMALEASSDPVQQEQLRTALKDKYQDFHLFYYLFRRPTIFYTEGDNVKETPDDVDFYGHPLDESKERYPGSLCEEEDNSHICRKQCHKIFTEIEEIERCKQFPIAQIAKLFELNETLKDPNYEKLKAIDIKDFEVYHYLSPPTLESRFSIYNADQAKSFILWVARNKEIPKLLIEWGYFPYNILDTLFEKIIGPFDYHIHEPFVQKVNGRENLMEIAMIANNGEAIKLFYNYIKGDGGKCNDGEISQTCFTVFCEIGKETQAVFRRRWPNQSEVFGNYIDHIVLAEINGISNPTSGQWDTDVFKSGKDVNDFYTDLCGDLAAD